jgi:diguanylate cyclase (GGDEF)-like protein
MKIVLVDDEPFVLGVLERQLARHPDLEIGKFDDPERALEWLETNEPDLVIVDYVMPKVDGLEFIRRLRARAELENTPIIMLTGRSERQLMLKALELGANDFLRKPADLLETHARVGSLLKLRTAALALKSANAALVVANQELTRLATIDALTEVYNRRYFLERADDEFARVRRYGGTFSVIMLDIDHFKRINDSHGHASGDVALKHVAGLANGVLRSMDYLGRLGGEEFAINLPETDAPGAQLVAERLRVAIETNPVRLDATSLTITSSFGVATYAAADADFAALLNRADAALYRAKSGGRNRVQVDAEPEPAVAD